MNTADEPVDRNLDADRQSPGPDAQAEEPGETPPEFQDPGLHLSEPEPLTPDEAMFPAGPAEQTEAAPRDIDFFSEPGSEMGGPAGGELSQESLYPAGPAEATGRARDTQPAGATIEPPGGADFPDEKSIYISGPLEKVAPTETEKPPKKRRRRKVAMIAAAPVLIAAAAVGWLIWPFAGGKQELADASAQQAGVVPTSNTTAASVPAPETPVTPPSAAPTSTGETPAEMAVAPKSTPPATAASQPTAPAVAQPPAPSAASTQSPEGSQAGIEKVAGIALVPVERLTGKISTEDREDLAQLKETIITGRGMSQADYGTVSRWLTSVATKSQSAEVEDLLLLMRVIKGEGWSGVSAPGGSPEPDVSPSDDGGVSRPKSSRLFREQIKLVRNTLDARLVFSLVAATFVAAEDEAPDRGDAQSPDSPGVDEPPPNLKGISLKLWRKTGELFQRKDASAANRVAACRTYAELCLEVGQSDRALKYASEARKILDGALRDTTISAEDRGLLRDQQAPLTQVLVRLNPTVATRVESTANRMSIAAGQSQKSAEEAKAQAKAAKDEAQIAQEARMAVQKEAQAAQEARQAWQKYVLADLQQRIEAVKKQAPDEAARKLIEPTEQKLAALAKKTGQEGPGADQTAELNQLAQEVRTAESRAVPRPAMPGSVPVDAVTKSDLARAMDEVKQDLSTARKTADQATASVSQLQARTDEDRRTAASAVENLRKELEKRGVGAVAQAMTPQEIEKIVGDVVNRVSATVTQYAQQGPVILRGPLGRIRQVIVSPAPAPSPPQVAAVEPTSPPAPAPSPPPAMTPPNPAEAVKPVAEPAPAAQQLVDSKLKSLLEPASQEPDPLLAGEMFSRGYSAFFVGMSDEALDYFVSAIRQDPKNSLYRYYLALTLRKLGRPADAETQVRVGRRFESPTWRYGIGSSLQRVQGPDRDWLERLRLQM